VKIPNLAIHLTTAEERNKFTPNLESHLKPVLSSQVYEQLAGLGKTELSEGRKYKIIYLNCKEYGDLNLFF